MRLLANIFSLFGEVLIDNTNANKSIDTTTEKAEKSGSKIGSAFGKIAKGAAVVGTAVVTGAAAVGTAAFKMASDTADAADHIDKMAQKIGISREAYQEWDYVLGQNGMSVDALQNGMKTLRSQMNAVMNGNEATAATFESLGVSVTNADGSMRSQEEVLNDTIAALQGVTDDAEKATLAQQLFGKAGIDMIPLLNQTAESTQGLKDQAHELGMIMGDEAIDAGVAFGDSLDTVKNSFTGLTNQLGAAVLPLITSFLNLIIEHIPDIQALFARLTPIMESLFDSVLPPLFDLIESLLPVLFDLLETLLPVFESIITAILPVIVDLLQLLLPFLVEIIQQILPIVIELIQALMPLFAQILETILPVIIDLLRILLPPLIEIIQAILPVVINLLNTVIPLVLQIIQSLLPVLLQLLETFTPIFKPILSLITSVLSPLMELINMILPPIISLLTSIFEKVLPPLQQAFSFVAEIITTVFGSALESLGPIIESVTGIFSGIIDFIKNVFTGNWQGAWDAVKNIFGNIWEAIKEVFKAPINWIIDGINVFIRGLNKIKIPDWVPVVGGKGLNIKEIPRLRVGIDYVPYDEYPAMLHKGERVLTAGEAEEYSQSEVKAAARAQDEEKKRPVVYIQLGEKAIYIEHLDGADPEDLDSFVDVLLELIADKIKREEVVFA